MTYVSTTALASCAFVCATLFSIGSSEQGTLSLSVESAQARVGNPLTPVSVAGVARRHHRRAAYGYGYGAGVAGAAAVGTVAAVGTAAAVAASPNWGWGSNTWTNSYAAQTDPHFGQPLYAHRAYYGHSPYYGYTGWDDYSTRNSLKCHPGGTIKLDDGHMYSCQ